MSNLSKSIGSLAGMLNQAEQRTPVMLAIEFIDTAPQVRTEFDEESLQELAADIKERGVRSPIEVRTTAEGRWLVIAGERRLRAARLAGKTEIPAYVEDMDDEAAEEAQLLENIQREDLTTADIAALIGRRYNYLKDKGVKSPLSDIAKTFKKSEPWVSKHLAVATKLGPNVARLLSEGLTQDIEILLALQKLEPLSYSAFWDQVKALEAGKATRTSVRKALEEAQAKADERKAQQKKEKKAQADKAKKGPAAPAFDPEEAIYEATSLEEGEDIGAIVATWPTDGLNEVATRLMEQWEAGVAAAGSGPAGAIPELMRHYKLAEAAYGGSGFAEFRAFLAGLAGEEFDAVAILASAREFNARKVL